MATAPVSSRLNLTRDQLAEFLSDQQQIRQFELLFSVVDKLQEIIGIDFLYQAANSAATANEALAQISVLAKDTAVDDAVLNAKIQQVLDVIPRLVQDTKINDAVLNAKVQQALDAIPRLAQALELLSLSPVRNNIELAHDVNGILPVLFGGTGQSTFTNGQLLIGNTTGNTLTKSTLTQGANITITNSTGSITIAVSGLGTMAFQNVGISGTADLAKITSLGTDGSLTFTNGIITAYVAPT